MKFKKFVNFIVLIMIVSVVFSACEKSDNDENETVSVSETQTVNTPTSDITNPSSAEPISSDNEEITAQTKVQTTKETTTQRKSVSVTIPEGYSFMQIAKTLESKNICTAKEFYKAAQSYKVKSFTIPSSSNRCFKLEGYLFPDTYEFYENEEPVTVIRKRLNNYAAKSGMPTDKELIIASIIEKEVRSDSHMKMVSSVFHNRIKKGMKLESDPTREYVNDYITGNSLLSGNTSKYAALYNTYKCKLPAGPICSPGARAIAAAKNPASSDYLYFFFGNDNTNHYSKTYEEHKEQMEKYGVSY